MNLYALHYFVTLAHLEHYTQASKVLGISQFSGCSQVGVC